METIWAIPIGEDRYVLDNSPFCAYSVSWKDTVHAPHVEEDIDELVGEPGAALLALCDWHLVYG